MAFEVGDEITWWSDGHGRGADPDDPAARRRSGIVDAVHRNLASARHRRQRETRAAPGRRHPEHRTVGLRTDYVATRTAQWAEEIAPRLGVCVPATAELVGENGVPRSLPNTRL
ncbi:hypothetical protein ACFYTF_14985 [Nocardia thailandica]|uniref:Uncharacterized protein n=1 Tax=Nocardia thailandica TaxID=257275 RepID=A0ABW6PP75_9NOCA